MTFEAFQVGPHGITALSDSCYVNIFFQLTNIAISDIKGIDGNEPTYLRSVRSVDRTAR